MSLPHYAGDRGGGRGSQKIGPLFDFRMGLLAPASGIQWRFDISLFFLGGGGRGYRGPKDFKLCRENKGNREPL